MSFPMTFILKCLCILIYIQRFWIGGSSLHHESNLGPQSGKVMTVGVELENETMPLQGGTQLYWINGLKENSSYEVKISYPASIPASFSIELGRGIIERWIGRQRRLLNTEKLIFKADFQDLDDHDIYALVTVKPEGFVALPGVKERELIFFNIVCDELLLGIPHAAWYVAIVVALCLVLAFTIPAFLPRHLLPRRPRSPNVSTAVTKDA